MNTTPLTLEQFDELAESGEINTVVCATPDPYGRLVGKRLTIQAFRSLGLSGVGINASSFVFAVDLEMNPLDLPVSNAALYEGPSSVASASSRSSSRRCQRSARVRLCSAIACR